MDPTRLVTEEGRLAWLAARRKGIGSSDAAGILGISKWTSPLHVYLTKVGELEQDETNPMRWGRVLEQVVAQTYSDLSGRGCHMPLQAIHARADLPWMLASLDRIAIVDGEPRVVELKAIGFAGDDWGVEGTDEVPDVYRIQVQHQLAVMDWKTADIGVLVGNQDFKVYTLTRDEQLITKLMAIESDFWSLVQRREPPPMDYSHPRTAELVKVMYGVGTDISVHLGQNAQEALDRYLQAREREKQQKHAALEARLELQDLMGNAAFATLPDGSTMTRKLVRRRGYEVGPTEYVDFRIRVKEDD